MNPANPELSGVDRLTVDGHRVSNRGASSAGVPDDAELMHLFKGGDTKAYEQLVHRHLDFVHRHALRYVGDTSSADDVAQEVFLRLYRSADLFRDPSNFKGWLATMTHRLALNELRTRKRKRWTARSSLNLEGEAAEWTPGNELDGPERQLLRDERIDLVRAAICELPERQRQALWLQRFEGWDLEQLGQALDMSIPAIKSLLHRARGALMKILEPYMKGEAGLTSTEPRPDGELP